MFSEARRRERPASLNNCELSMLAVVENRRAINSRECVLGKGLFVTVVRLFVITLFVDCSVLFIFTC